MSRLDFLRSWWKQFDRQQRQRLARVASLAGGVVLAAVIVVSTGLNLRDLYDWRNRPSTPIAKPRPAVVPAAPTVRSIHHEDPKDRLGTDASASKIALQLHLIRTVPGQNAHTGQALLGVDRNHPQTYLAGAILENGSRLDEIYRDRVVLVKGNRHTTLYIEAAGAPTGTGSAATDALAMVGGMATTVESPHLSIEPITDYLRPVPVYRDSAIAGFQVYPGAHPAPFSKWGLQPGDVMTELDGQPVADADQLMQMLSGLIDGQALAATIQRGAATLSVTLDGAEVERLRAANNRPLPPPITP